MKSLEEAEAAIADHEGTALAHATFIAALVQALPPDVVRELQGRLAIEAEKSRVLLLNSAAPETATHSFDQHMEVLQAEIDDRLHG